MNRRLLISVLVPLALAGAGRAAEDKAAFIDKAGVDVVAATDAGCLMNIAGCLRRRGSAVQAMHLAEVLEKT